MPVGIFDFLDVASANLVDLGQIKTGQASKYIIMFDHV